MRFIPNGPSLPDELLIARDAGEVLFFCGSGVSRAFAHLPDFACLARKVLKSLGSAQKSPARKLFNGTRELEKKSGLTGLVATDRIFGLLEREFEPREMREDVAMALKPQSDCKLDAHRILLDLSRTPTGVSRLVTTNFDLLFEECEPTIESSNPPRLPDPCRDSDFQGIIHLHGCVDSEYSRARDDKFVLSSADFGHAYLADGWATRYIQALLQRFQIVFVGYSADDPPVQYLLEALNRFGKPDHALYAFQSDDKTHAMEQWHGKGVEPIAYNSANRHAALWETLSAWAERARDVDGWHENLITKAANGPASMAPHERGMIAHLAATTTGAECLAKAQHPLPADWLCVLDRNVRYAPPYWLTPRFDPFDAYGLDSDVPPAPCDPNALRPMREVPKDAWDAMATTSDDLVKLPIVACAPLRGNTADAAPKLPPRLGSLGVWIAKIAHQPGTLWWAAQQTKLHPQIQSSIDHSLSDKNKADRYTPAVRNGWRLLRACWQQRITNPNGELQVIKKKAEIEGWSPSLVRDAIALYRPKITASRLAAVNKAPESSPALVLGDIVHFSVDYPHLHTPLGISPNILGYAVGLFREQLEYAVQLEGEITDIRLSFGPTRTDDGDTCDETKSYGLTGHLIAFTNKMMQLAKADNNAARREVSCWSRINNDVFIRLRIWAGGQTNLTTAQEAGQIFLCLDSEAFWLPEHELDLLFALRDRWDEMAPSTITELENRLCEGNELVSGYPIADDERLNKLHWLENRGVIFSDACKKKIALLQADSPECTADAAKDTGASFENLPTGKILEQVLTCEQDDFYCPAELDFFRNLVEVKPARALSAITDTARKIKFVPWTWSALLSSDSEKAKSLRMLRIIGHRLARLTPSHLAEIANPVSEWLLRRSEKLLSECPKVFGLVWGSMIAALEETIDLNQFPRADRSWVDKSRHTPVALMTSALFGDPALKNFESNRGLPENWKCWLNQLLGLPNDHRRYAIVMITRNLNWLFDIDPQWTKQELLPLAGDEKDDGSAFWDGYFWRDQLPQRSLYQELKPHVVELAQHKSRNRNHADGLAKILLVAWGRDEESSNTERPMKDDELREILIDAGNDLRTRMLWHLKCLYLTSESQWSHRLIPFLKNVWPRQISARNDLVSFSLADMALAIPDRFSEIVPAILKRLVPFNGAILEMNNLLSNTDTNIIQNYPEVLLTFLQAILHEDRYCWPIESTAILDRLAEQSETKDDPRLAKLRRREQQR